VDRLADPEALRRRFPRVAITHEWLTVPGGSEQVVLRILDLFPGAEIFTTVYDPARMPEFDGRRVHTSFLDRLPGATRRYQRLLPLMNAAFESFDLSAFDLVISSNHACAKNVTTRPETLHVCYCHTPMRYAWDPAQMRDEPVPRPLRPLVPPLLARLRRQDLAASARPHHYLANSRAVQERIRRFYRRDSTLLHPPVEVDRMLATPRAAQDYYLCLGRLVPYKRADLAVAACSRLGRRLKVVGEGRAGMTLRDRAGPTIEFLGRVSDDCLPLLFAGARALLFPGEEDFGIVPVEAQAAGVPVIALGRGGARDSVVDGRTGVLFGQQTAEALAEAILRFERSRFDEAAVRENAKQFGPQHFLRGLASFLQRLKHPPQRPIP
jgi:glycosyltransferase involved in cell wall biosynthesis